MIPEAVRRLLESGLEKLGDRPDQIRQKLSDMKLPREAYSALLHQLDDGKSGLYRIVAKEVRDFLENTNFAEDLVKALTTLSFEIKTEVRFIPNDAGTARPNVKSKLRVGRQSDTPRRPSDPMTPDPTNNDGSPHDDDGATSAPASTQTKTEDAS